MTGLEIAALACLGAAAGTIAGLLGVGGGIIVVPGLAFLLPLDTIPPERVMQIAVGTSLATIVATSLSSIRAHHRRQAVRWPIVARLTPGIVLGAALGALIADILPTRALAIVFGVFLILVSIRLALPGQPAPHRQLPGAPGLAVWGTGIGALSSLLGIGGGTMTVPLLTWCNVPLRQAVGTSAAGGLPIALAGAVSFALAGWDTVGLPAGATGYVYWAALLALAPATVLFAPVGARLAHTVPTHLLRQAFAVFVLIVGVRMLIG